MHPTAALCGVTNQHGSYQRRLVALTGTGPFKGKSLPGRKVAATRALPAKTHAGLNADGELGSGLVAVPPKSGLLVRGETVDFKVPRQSKSTGPIQRIVGHSSAP